MMNPSKDKHLAPTNWLKRGEARDLRVLKMEDTCPEKSFFDISFNSGQICIGFKADTPEKWQQHVHRIRLSDIDLVIDKQPNIYLEWVYTRKNGAERFFFIIRPFSGYKK